MHGMGCDVSWAEGSAVRMYIHIGDCTSIVCAHRQHIEPNKDARDRGMTAAHLVSIHPMLI